MAQPRISLTLLQALLGLLALAWLAMDVAGARGPLPLQSEDFLVLSETADHGQQESEARASDRKDGEGDPDEFAAAGLSEPMAYGAGEVGFRRDSLPAILFGFIARHATGPPGL